MSNLLMTPELLQVAVSMASGFAVVYLVWVVTTFFGKTVAIPVNSSSFEFERRSVLESTSSIYRNVQPLVFDLAKADRLFFDTNTLESLSKSLVIAVDAVPWKPEEYIAVKQIEGFLAGLVVAAISLVLGSLPIAILVAISVAGIYQVIAITSVHENAKNRLRIIKMRLPFVIDLMALMIEAGATFRDSLKTVVRENRDHSLGTELARVDRQIELGRPRAKALGSFQDRLNDHDVTELVFAINKGEELGTPLAKVLRNQADQMRLKRSQWGEKAAAEAQVKMAFPGMIVMIACVLVVLAPIILPAVSAFSEL